MCQYQKIFYCSFHLQSVLNTEYIRLKWHFLVYDMYYNYNTNYNKSDKFKTRYAAASWDISSMTALINK